MARKHRNSGAATPEGESLASLVRRIVKQHDLTLRDVEQRSGGQITNSYISKIISGGIRSVTVEKLMALAQGLNVDPHILFTAACGREAVSESDRRRNGVDAEWLVEMNQRVLSSAELAGINRKLLDLGADEHRIVLKYLTQMTEKKHKKRGKEGRSHTEKTFT